MKITHTCIACIKKRYFLFIFTFLIISYIGISNYISDKNESGFRCAFLSAMQDIYQDSPGVLRPSYVDNNYCYFLSKDEGCIYRYSRHLAAPELIISDAACFTITDQGILFFRPNQSDKSQLSSLILWQDGKEYPVRCKDDSFSWCNFLAVGDYLFYDALSVIKVCEISLDTDTPTLGNTTLSIPDCQNLTDLLWTDGFSIWYLANRSSGYGEICKFDIATGMVESLGISTIGSRDRRHDIYPAVQNGTYYYQVNGTDKNIYALDLTSETVNTIGTIPDEYLVCVYGATTGQSFVQIRTYDGGDPVATTRLFSQDNISYLANNTVRTVYDGFIIANEYDVLDFDCYHRTVIYNENGQKVWASCGSIYFNDY